ncbi:CD63 antigen-like [Pseudomyrmex gracilis]|uniref:CD63 antigen-like n=1 Tax=Pseudomyrmex gracilis TaxID=219809 RepID=UPI00099509AE|nr:CD63 antigen-like [Pseudomyrmex gracilis]
MATMRLSLAPRTVKYLIFILNFLFVITGIILVSVGAIFHEMYNEYQHFLDNSFLSVSNLLIAVGSIIFFIAFFGCCGAVRENYCMITTFCTLLIAIFVLEIIGGTMGYVMRSKVETIVEDKMLDTMKQYNNSQEIKVIWDNIQRKFDCCGMNNPSDWINSTVQLHGLPMSCCEEVIGAVGTVSCTVSSPNLHKDGCADMFVNFAKTHAAKLAGVGMGLGVIQLLGILLSSYLAKSIRNCYQNM